MSRENVEIVRSIYEELTSRLDAPEDLFDPDYEMDMTDLADIGAHRGVAAAREAFRQYAQTFDDFRIDLVDVIHADDVHVVTEVRDGGRMKESDAEIWNRYFNAWTFRNGKVLRVSSHTDRARALEAAGIASSHP